MREDDESASRSASDADRGNKKKAKKKRVTHVHIGPNLRAFKAGLAFCPSCDADKIIRLTDVEREHERYIRELAKKR